MTRHTTHPAEGAPGAGAGDALAASAREIGARAAGQAGGENFPVALRLLPRRYRQHLGALYGFARSVDDMGDEAPKQERLALLDEMEADVRRLYRPAAADVADGPRLGVVQALRPLVTQCGVPMQPFLDLVEANRQDQVVTRYQTFADLVAYCRLSANPVGRVVLYVFGAATPAREELSDYVCTALQLAEHWQDVAEDYQAGRIYLPREDMDSAGCREADLAEPTASEPLRALLAFEATRARELLDRGAPLVGTLRGAARAAVAGYVAGGRAALAAVTATGADVLVSTPKPRPARVAAELARSYATGR
ncbi:MAG TPA: squalene synthase HpnC [Streptosporangiaceae bacterium]|nr:squalene synthase HpnC [Streptosporangiaceae bacterium]